MFAPLVPANAGTQELKSLAFQGDPGFPLEPVIGRPKAGPVGGNERSVVRPERIMPHPFSPPEPQPATMYRWMTRNTISTGATTRTPAAMIIPQSTTLAL